MACANCRNKDREFCQNVCIPAWNQAIQDGGSIFPEKKIEIEDILEESKSDKRVILSEQIN